MAEAAEAPKKKGKLPTIVALVAMLVAGGFFGMKMGGGSGKEEEKTLELGEIAPLGEFLVNLSDGRTFLRTEISVHLAKDAHLDGGKSGGDGHGGSGKAEAPAPVKDAVISVLTSKSLADVSSPAGKDALRKAIAEAINAAVPHHDKDGQGNKEAKGDKAKKPGKKKAKGGDHVGEEPEVIDETWDSQTGPVLKVYFTSFATQQ